MLGIKNIEVANYFAFCYDFSSEKKLKEQKNFVTKHYSEGFGIFFESRDFQTFSASVFCRMSLKAKFKCI